MFEQEQLTHHIQRDIIATLLTHEYASFSELKPKKVDSNLFSYHLKLLQKNGFVTKTGKGYTLSRKGLIYADRVSAEHMRVRTQPKIITMLLIQNSEGDVLVYHRRKQPYINTWTLPHGKLHIDDESVLAAARRESVEKLGYNPPLIRHAGDCYIVVSYSGRKKPADHSGPLASGDTVAILKQPETIIETRTLAHIMRFETDDIAVSDTLMWVNPLDLPRMRLAPAVEQIVARAFFNDQFFFEEFTVRANTQEPLSLNLAI